MEQRTERGSVLIELTTRARAWLESQRCVVDEATLEVVRPDGTRFGLLGQDAYLRDAGVPLPPGSYYDPQQVRGACAWYDLSVDVEGGVLRYRSNLWHHDVDAPALERKARAKWEAPPSAEKLAALEPRWGVLQGVLRSPSLAPGASGGPSVQSRWLLAASVMEKRVAEREDPSFSGLLALHEAVTGEASRLRAVGSAFEHRFEQEFLPASAVPQALREWEAWIRSPSKHPVLRAAWACRRLMSIHPFADGNGRVARLVLDWMLARARFPSPLFTTRAEAHCAVFARSEQPSLDEWLERLTKAMERAAR